MRVLVVGGTSTVGMALRAQLEPDDEVVTAGRSGCDVALDLRWPAERFALPPADAVVHTAAHFGGADDAAREASSEVNALGTLKLCHAAARAGAAHLVLVSTIFAALPEDSPHFGAYALSKRHGEDLARLACRAHGLPLAVLRPSQIYGVGPRFRELQPFLYAMLDRARSGEDVVLFGSRDPRRNYIHVDDVAAVVARVVRGRVTGTYACQYPSDVTYGEIAHAAIRAFGGSGRVVFDPARPDVPDNVAPRDEALYERIGFRPSAGILQALAALVPRP